MSFMQIEETPFHLPKSWGTRQEFVTSGWKGLLNQLECVMSDKIL